MKKKLVLLLALVMLLATLFSVPTQAEMSERDYVDSWEVTENMTDEEPIAIVEEVLTCEQGTIPDHAFAALFRMQDIDPELAEAGFKHIESIALPATPPAPPEDQVDAPSEQSENQEQFSVYVRDGYGGHYEYYYPEDLEDKP